MKKKSLFCIVLTTIIFLAFFAVAACRKENPPKLVEGSETGMYYSDREESSITLNSGNQFTFFINEVTKSGEYKLDGETLTFTFRDEEMNPIDADFKNDVIYLTYSDLDMRFFRNKNYTVSFDTHEGSAIASVSVRNGRTVSKPEVIPTRSGHVFNGWYTSDTFTTKFEFDSYAITANTTIHAKWQQKIVGVAEFMVGFDANYPAGVTAAKPNFESIETIGGRLYNAPVLSNITGYTFEGWWVSMYEDGKKLAHAADDTVYEENTTLYALWKSTASLGSKFAEPAVQVKSGEVEWKVVTGASRYAYKITGPAGFATVEDTTNDVKLSQIDFSIAGDYVITVTAEGPGGANASEPVVRYYKNKALAKVSLFKVAEPSMLIFNEVKNAVKYSILIICGDDLHTHNYTYIDNGSFASYDFSNCAMQPGGIKFKVKAEAQGWVTSISSEFKYERNLSEISGFVFDTTTQTLSWDAVPNATNYNVSVKYKGEESLPEIDNGSKTSYCIKEYDKREMQISVTPNTKGWNSPSASIYPYTKTTLATPQNIRVDNMLIKWTKVEGATGYEVRIGGTTIPVDAIEPDPEDEVDPFVELPNTLDLSDGVEYEVSIRAIGAGNSLWTDTVIIGTSVSSLVYFQNELSWKHVIGAVKYEVRINKTNTITIEGGLNKTAITLPRAGDNTIEVVPYGDKGQFLGMSSIGVYAYAITFEGGKAANSTQFVAADDIITLPELEKDGYKLVNWYTTSNAAAGGERITGAIRFTGMGDITLYSYWTGNPYDVVLSYGDEAETTTETTVIFGESAVLDVPAMTCEEANGRLFLGWFFEESGTGTKFANELGEIVYNWQELLDDEEPTTLYAYWALPLEYTQVEANGVIGWAVSAGSNIGGVKSLVIPTQVTAENDEGETVTLPVTTIANLAFNNKGGIVNVIIPASVTTIEPAAFQGCTGLTAFKVDENNPNYCDIDGVLFSKDKKTLITYPRGGFAEYRIPDSVVTIGDKAFMDNKALKNITLPDSLKYIGDYAFYSCTGLAGIVFPDNLEFIGGFAFTADYNASMGLSGVITFPGSLTNIGTNAFEYCQNIDTIIFKAGPEDKGILIISDDAFAFCSGITTITFEEGCNLNTLAGYVFYECTGIKNLLFPASLERIEDMRTFQGCTDLLTVDFDDIENSKLTYIGNYTFLDCTSLESVTLPEGIAILGTITETISYGDIFSGCTSLVDVNLPDSLEMIAGGIFDGCSDLVSITIPKSVRFIDASAFQGCTKLFDIDVAEDNPYLDATSGVLFDKEGTLMLYAPGRMTGTILEIPEGTIAIGAAVFQSPYMQPSAFTKVILPDSLISIGDYAFADCTNLEEVNFGGNLNSIGIYAFLNCALSEITIPASVEFIGTSAFSGNYQFEEDYDYRTGSYTVIRDDGLVSVIFEDNSLLTRIDESTFSGCEKLATVDFGNGGAIEFIGSSAFANCSFESIVLPDSVTTIDRRAFASCRQLVDITLSASLHTFGGAVFANSDKLTEITIPVGLTNFNPIDVFEYSSIASINVDDGNSSYSAIGGILFNKTGTVIIYYPPKSTSTTFTIPVAMTEVDTGILASSSYLTDILVADGNQNFSQIDGVLFNKAGTDIIFYPKARTATTYTIPDTMTVFNVSVFSTNTKINDIIANADNDNFSDIDGVLFNKTGTEIIFYPKARTATTYTIPNDVTTIGDRAFENCTKLTSITFPDSLTTIGANVFSGCTDLKTLTISIGVTTISAFALTGSSINSFQIVDGNENFVEINGAFFDVAETTLVFYPSSNTATTFTISATLVNIDIDAIIANANIKEIHVADSHPNFVEVDGVIFNKTKSKLLFYPRTKTDTTYTIPSTVTTIGAYAFKGCTTLEEIIIQEGVTTIGTQAFYGCDGISSFVVPISVTEIGSLAFYNSSQNVTVQLAGRTAIPNGWNARGWFNGMKWGYIQDKDGNLIASY